MITGYESRKQRTKKKYLQMKELLLQGLSAEEVASKVKKTNGKPYHVKTIYKIRSLLRNGVINIK